MRLSSHNTRVVSTQNKPRVALKGYLVSSILFSNLANKQKKTEPVNSTLSFGSAWKITWPTHLLSFLFPWFPKSVCSSLGWSDFFLSRCAAHSSLFWETQAVNVCLYFKTAVMGRDRSLSKISCTICEAFILLKAQSCLYFLHILVYWLFPIISILTCESI